MKIAIDISPLSSGHKIRGVGFYLQHLKDALEKYFPEHAYTFFTDAKGIPENIDIVHYPYFDPFFITLPFIKKCKTIVTIHDLTPIVFPKHFPSGIKGKVKWETNKFLLKHVDGIITDSDSSTKDVRSYIGVDKEKIKTIYLAAGEEFRKMQDAKHTMELRKKYNLPKKFVLYVGDVTWNKNLPRLIEAVTRIHIPLVMVGKALIEKNFNEKNAWNDDRIKIQQLTHDNKNTTRIGFVSNQDLVALYNMAAVFVMPSLYEGFGLPILEAMACGCPVITSQEGSLGEVAENAAYFIDPYSVEDIASGIKTVFLNTHLQKSLAEKGLMQAKKFSWKKTAKETIEAYAHVLQNTLL